MYSFVPNCRSQWCLFYQNFLKLKGEGVFHSIQFRTGYDFLQNMGASQIFQFFPYLCNWAQKSIIVVILYLLMGKDLHYIF